MGKLTDKQVRALGAGTYGDGGGLYLKVFDTGARCWLFRFKRGAKSSWAGLGGFPVVALAQAREAALEAKRGLRQGINPIQAKKAAKSAAEAIKPHLFLEVAKALIASKKAGWKNGTHAEQWLSSLELYAFPALGSLDVAAVGFDAVVKILEPIWTEKTETASRVRGRIEAVLDYARVHGWRTGENPARWKGNLEYRFAAKTKVMKVEHHAAVDWREMPALWAEIRDRDAVSFQCLKFIILTAARSGEARGATWDEIDLSEKVWTIPSNRMKAGRLHRVPLCDEALAVLKSVKMLAGVEPDALVFPGGKQGKSLSDVAVSKALGTVRSGVTVHGFRSSFRDWCAEAVHCPREVAEAALAHQNADRVEAAYARADLLDRRRVLMKAWGGHLNISTSA